MKKLLIAILSILLLSTVISTAADELEPPVFSHEGGFYTDEFELELSSKEKYIYYTLNGSEPDPINNAKNTYLYTSKIQIKKPTHTDVYAMLPSNPSFDLRQNFNEYRRESRGWLPPYAPSNKAVIIRAISANDAGQKSKVVTNTYFIEPKGRARYTLPVLSIATDPDGLFSNEKGILVPGTSSTPNYEKRGDEWERVVNLELYDTNNQKIVSSPAGVKTRGGGGRHSTQKSLTLNPRKEYGNAKIKNTFLLDTAAKKYGKLILRNGGQGPNHMGFDDLAGKLAMDNGLDSQHTQHVVTFIDGEYWGIYSLKETADADYLEATYGAPKENFAVLEINATVVDGNSKDAQYFKDLVKFAQSNDLNNEENYKYLEDRIDFENLATYFILQSYIANTDWPHNNIRYWRYRTERPLPDAPYGLDGKWRWLLYDADCIFGSRYDSSAAQMNFSYNALNSAINNNNLSSNLLKALLKSQRFSDYFKARLEDMLNITLTEERLLYRINELDNTIKPEILEHVIRWRYPAMATSLAQRELEVPSSQKWDYNISQMRLFAAQRPAIFKSHYKSYFKMPANDHKITITWDKEGGEIIGTTMPLPNTGSFTGSYSEGLNFAFTAKAKSGYKFSGWVGTYTSKNPNLYVNLNGDIILEAVFEKI
ncbi:MAG: hypothetical protein GX196_00225 [Clostridiaceae bacterium]|nr:hypothetical protein [Clostridiaceae bacterium]